MTTIARIQSHVLHVSPKTNWWFLSVTDSSGAVGALQELQGLCAFYKVLGSYPIPE